MDLNKNLTCKYLIEPALKQVGCEWRKEVSIVPGRVNRTGENMVDRTQTIKNQFFEKPFQDNYN